MHFYCTLKKEIEPQQIYRLKILKYLSSTDNGLIIGTVVEILILMPESLANFRKMLESVWYVTGKWFDLKRDPERSASLWNQSRAEMPRILVHSPLCTTGRLISEKSAILVHERHRHVFKNIGKPKQLSLVWWWSYRFTRSQREQVKKPKQISFICRQNDVASEVIGKAKDKGKTENRKRTMFGWACISHRCLQC